MKKTCTIISVSGIFLFLLSFVNNVRAQQVTIGNQTWTSTNLDVSTFRNGDAIQQATTKEEWAKAGENKQPAWCYYKYDPANNTKYGKLYNWYAVNDPRGLAPKGWHIPSNDEWTKLTDHLGGESVAGIKLKSSDGWKGGPSPNGTNESGFNALPGGFCKTDGSWGIGSVSYMGFWWSATEFSGMARRRMMTGKDNVVDNIYFGSKEEGMSVRCIKD